MKLNLPSVKELNEIQAQWMALDSTGPKAEIDRVCKLMERYPKIYVSGHDGNGVCIIGGSPFSMTVPFEQALETCRQLGGRVDVAWNGTAGKWYSLPNVKRISDSLIPFHWQKESHR